MSIKYNSKVFIIIEIFLLACFFSLSSVQAKEYQALNKTILKYTEKTKILESQSKDAELNLAQLKPNKANASQVQEIQEDISSLELPTEEAQLDIATTHLTSENYLRAIDVLEKLKPTEGVNYSLAKAYYEIERYDLALKKLEDNKLKEAKDLKETIQMLIRPKFEPFFGFHEESGNLNSKVDFKEYGGEFTFYPKPNYGVKSGISATPFVSKNGLAHTTATLYYAGFESKPTNNLSFDCEAGIDSYSNGGVGILGDASLIYSLNDFIVLDLGYIRQRQENSVLSAVGLTPEVGPFANELVGRVKNNQFNSGIELKLPHKSYSSLNYNLGYRRGSNVPANPYHEISGEVGKIFYSDPKNSLLNLVQAGYGLFYETNKENRSGFGGASLEFSPLGSDGISPEPSPNNPGIGGYFSPEYLVSNIFNIQFQGNLAPANLSYIFTQYLGTQSIKNEGTNILWGSAISIGINEKGKKGIRIGYQADNFNLTRHHNFIIKLIYRF
ncbi:MAG: hypothetical protein A2104_05955 [Candidatus Melainabacteria bacterium GWF2_32_7]|nr:MAG: hypothetical protein A2104_05955 [Candidatus Melainabacteria bacterium GWF2_32_7]